MGKQIGCLNYTLDWFLCIFINQNGDESRVVNVLHMYFKLFRRHIWSISLDRNWRWQNTISCKWFFPIWAILINVVPFGSLLNAGKHISTWSKVDLTVRGPMMWQQQNVLHRVINNKWHDTLPWHSYGWKTEANWGTCLSHLWVDLQWCSCQTAC